MTLRICESFCIKGSIFSQDNIIASFCLAGVGEFLVSISRFSIVVAAGCLTIGKPEICRLLYWLLVRGRGAFREIGAKGLSV